MRRLEGIEDGEGWKARRRRGERARDAGRANKGGEEHGRQLLVASTCGRSSLLDKSPSRDELEQSADEPACRG